jgi:monovalent cation:H+ antiporter, CPA1 family
LDEILNAVLFVLLGLEVLAVAFTPRYLAAGFLAIPIVLLARLVSVGVPVWLLPRRHRAELCAVRVLTWGGLRGALSVAMALSLPREVAGEVAPERQVILVMTYIVVVFSILVQGLTIGPFARHWLGAGGLRAPSGSLVSIAPAGPLG